MKSHSLLKSVLPAVLLAGLLGACGDDDPVRPDPSPWREVALDLSPGISRVAAVDFSGQQGLALGLILPAVDAITGIDHEFFRLQPDGGWLKEIPTGIPDEMVALDLAVDAAGGAVLAGFQVPGPPSLVVDLRGATPLSVEQATYGMVTVEGEGAFVIAGGRASGGGLWTSVGPGLWNFDDLPLSGTNDSGFRDVAILGDRAVACGYDDGADTLQVILSRTTTTDWRKIPAGGPFNATYFCIALDDAGTIFVGGIEGAGGMSPRAFLSRRTADGLWSDLPLPDAELLHGVMDILIAADGSLYLACMGEGDRTQANLVHLVGDEATLEITPFAGGLLQLGQAADGGITAVGFRRDGLTGDETGVMLARNP